VEWLTVETWNKHAAQYRWIRTQIDCLPVDPTASVHTSEPSPIAAAGATRATTRCAGRHRTKRWFGCANRLR